MNDVHGLLIVSQLEEMPHQASSHARLRPEHDHEYISIAVSSLVTVVIGSLSLHFDILSHSSAS